MKHAPAHRDRLKSRVLTAMGAAALITLLHLFGATSRADAWAYDHFTAWRQAPADDRIVVVAIDDRSLAELGRWPWSRRTHAELIGKLEAAGARGIGLNILLSEPALFDPEGDALLAQAMNRSRKVVLPIYAVTQNKGGAAVELMPIPEFAGSAAALGHVDMALDDDGVPRSMYLRAGTGAAHWPSLALALSQLGSDSDPSAEPPGLRTPGLDEAPGQQWVRDFQVLLPHADTANVTRVSYADVLRGRVPASTLQGHWVLVGITAPSLGNGQSTPDTGEEGSKLSGVDYQANALAMLIDGQAVVPLSMPAQIVLSLLLVLLPFAVTRLRALRTAWKSVGVAMLAVPVVSWVLLSMAHRWYPPMPALLVLGAGALAMLVGWLRRNRRQAESDPLTGLANRLKFDEELDQELRTARRTQQPLSLLVLDVDHFKRLNDGVGQPAGDEVLRALATILRGRARRPRDLVARLGADEFAVLLPETTPQAAAAIATTIHVDLANLPSSRNGQPPVPPFTASIGIHTTKGEEASAAHVFELADQALHQAKQAGRNRSSSHTSDRAARPPS